LKGQYFSFDAIIGGVIFILTAMALFSYWYGISGTLDQGHEMLAKEAFRISEMINTPMEPGLAMGWRDQHLNYTKIGEGHCPQWEITPQRAFGSGYGVSIFFNTVDSKYGVGDGCWWGESTAFNSDNIYRFRRVTSFVSEDGNTTLGYVDIYVYDQKLA